MPLKFLFPKYYQAIYATPSIEAGVVVKIFLNTVTPPKEKRVVIVGESPDKSQIAYVYINSRINKKVHQKRMAQRLHKKLDPKDRDYIDRTSYVDCTQLQTMEKYKIRRAIVKSPSRVIGWMSNFDYEVIKNNILSAPTIKGKHKKKFGFYA